MANPPPPYDAADPAYPFFCPGNHLTPRLPSCTLTPHSDPLSDQEEPREYMITSHDGSLLAPVPARKQTSVQRNDADVG